MGAASKASAPAAKVALFEKALATEPKIVRKGATIPYAAVNGNMFSQLDANGTMALRLPADEREAFLKAHKTKLFEAYGIVMREYVAVPDALLEKTAALAPYVAASYRYAASLKPKPTTRKPATKS